MSGNINGELIVAPSSWLTEQIGPRRRRLLSIGYIRATEEQQRFLPLIPVPSVFWIESKSFEHKANLPCALMAVQSTWTFAIGFTFWRWSLALAFAIGSMTHEYHRRHLIILCSDNPDLEKIERIESALRAAGIEFSREPEPVGTTTDGLLLSEPGRREFLSKEEDIYKWITDHSEFWKYAAEADEREVRAWAAKSNSRKA